MFMLRLQKYLAQCGVASRRKAEELIAEGRVRVNGKRVTTPGTKIDPAKDRVQVGRKILKPEKPGVILLNKPRGVVTTKSDPGGRRTVADYLDRRHASYVPAGRLDYDSSGLVVLTNDGELAARLTHPRYGIKRVYELRVRGVVSEKTVNRIKKGVRLSDGLARADIEILRNDGKSTWLRATLTVGKNRIVRRLMEKLGHPVVKLKRISHGPFKLGRLRVGEIQKLKQREYLKFKNALLGE
ncbi:MAG: rRNA pseudouridine synthase [Candidatus Dadabacteria bacterium]|nr:MAG: rRNA pseudouridine synthase [Candidatus Dadabacteria bacterium]